MDLKLVGRAGSVLVSGALLFSLVGCGSSDTETVPVGDASSQTAEEVASDSSAYTYGSTFVFSNFQFSIGYDYQFLKSRDDSRYQAYSNLDLIAIPVTIKNVSENKLNIPIGAMSFFAPDGIEFRYQGQQIAQMGLVDNELANMGYIRPSASVSGFIYLTNKGDGDYFIYFKQGKEACKLRMPIDRASQEGIYAQRALDAANAVAAANVFANDQLLNPELFVDSVFADMSFGLGDSVSKMNTETIENSPVEDGSGGGQVAEPEQGSSDEKIVVG